MHVPPHRPARNQKDRLNLAAEWGRSLPSIPGGSGWPWAKLSREVGLLKTWRETLSSLRSSKQGAIRAVPGHSAWLQIPAWTRTLMVWSQSRVCELKVTGARDLETWQASRGWELCSNYSREDSETQSELEFTRHWRHFWRLSVLPAYNRNVPCPGTFYLLSKSLVLRKDAL